MLMNLDVVIMQYKRGNNSVNVIRYLNGKGLIFELDNEKEIIASIILQSGEVYLRKENLNKI